MIYDMIYMMIYDMINDDIYDMIYLTVIGLTPGGSYYSTHLQTKHRTTQSTKTIHRTTQFV